MEEVDLGDDIRPLHYESSGSSHVGNNSEDDNDNQNQEPLQRERLSQRLRGSLQRGVTPLVGLRHSIATSTVDTGSSKMTTGSARERLRNFMRRRESPPDNQIEADQPSTSSTAPTSASKSKSKPLRSTMAAAGIRLVNEELLVLLGSTPLVQPQDDMLFLEHPDSSSPDSRPGIVHRGDFLRIQSPDDPSQSWLCQVAVDRFYSEADVLPLASPFPGPLVPDAIVHLVPQECLPSADDDPEDSSSSEEEEEESEAVSELRASVNGWRSSVDEISMADLRSSLDGWRSSVDDPADLSPGDDSDEGTNNNNNRPSGFFAKYQTNRARLRTSSAEYKEKLKAASQASKQKLAAASQVSKEKLSAASQVSKQKLAVAGQVSKEKMAAASQVSKEKLAAASVVSKEKLAVAGQVSKEKLAVAGHVSKEKLVVAGQVSKEKMAVAGHASKLKMQSWTSSAKNSLRAKMAQRAEQKTMTAAAGVDGVATEPLVFDSEIGDAMPATPPPKTNAPRVEEDAVRWSYEPTIDDLGEEELLRREVDEC